MAASSVPGSPPGGHGARGRRLARLLNVLGRLPGSGLFAHNHARLYIRSRGRLGSRWFGSPVLVLEVVGRKSGKRRLVPLIYTTHGSTPVVLAANAGNPALPAWWHNLRAAGRATLHLDGQRDEVVPRLLEGAARQEAWARFVAEAPSVGHYPTFTDRDFPLVALERAGGPTAGAPNRKRRRASGTPAPTPD